MLKNYYKLQLKILFRTFKKLHVAILLLAAFLSVFIAGIYQLDPEYRLALCVAVLLLLNEKRSDWYFLKSQYRKKANMIFVCDSLMLSLSFVIMHLLHNEFFFLAIPIVLGIFMPFLPRSQFNITIPGCPLFPIGAFEFQRLFRFFVIPYIILFAVGVIGVIYENLHLIEACTAFVCIMTAVLLWQPPERSWAINYCSVSQFYKIKLFQTLICGMEIMLPFLILLCVGGLSIEHTLVSLVAYLFLIEQIEMIRFVIPTNEIIKVFSFLFLLYVNYLSLGMPWFFLLSVLILVILSFGCYNKILNIIND